jgi:hypothetical protein
LVGGWESIRGWFSLAYFNWRLYLFLKFMEVAKSLKELFQSSEQTKVLPSIRDNNAGDMNLNPEMSEQANQRTTVRNQFERNVVEPIQSIAVQQGDAKEMQCGVTKLVFGPRQSVKLG